MFICLENTLKVSGVMYGLLKAQARCHRIGQQKMVKVYRLLCRNTYEREMFDKASLKLGLDKALLQSMNTTQGKDHNNKQLSKKEIEDLLKKGECLFKELYVLNLILM